MFNRKFVNDALDRMWKEAAMACLKVLSQHLPGMAKEHNKSQYSQSSGPGFNLRPVDQSVW
jgi:hypothetical protein